MRGLTIAEKLATLDLRNAQASNPQDLHMIQTLVQAMPGGFDAMNSFSVAEWVHFTLFRIVCSSIVKTKRLDFLDLMRSATKASYASPSATPYYWCAGVLSRILNRFWTI